MAQVTIQIKESKSVNTKCDCCGEKIRTCAKYQYVRGYGKHCLSDDCSCALLDSLALNGDYVAEESDGEEGLRMREQYGAYRAAGCADAYWTDRDAGYFN